MATFVIPFHVNGKTRLGDRRLAQAMLADVRAAAGSALVVDEPGGQGAAVAAALTELSGPVTIRVVDTNHTDDRGGGTRRDG